MECFDFEDLSSLDLIAGTGVNPGCTPIKFPHFTKSKRIFGARKRVMSPYVLKSNSLQPASSTPPSILRRGRHRQHRGSFTREELKEDQYELYEGSFDDDHIPINQLGQLQPLPTTPVRIPIESLPFSPSQFLNSSHKLSKDRMTSTPSVSQTSYYCPASINSVEPVTPRNHHVAQQSFSPHTPTPFKDALAEVERRTQSKPWSPSDLDDLGEVLKECDTGFEADHMGYEADHSSGFTPVSQTQQCKRKFSKETSNQRQEKIQKKSAKKIIFVDSPSKEEEKVVTLDPVYQKVACGLTKDQLDMTQLAKSYYL